MLRVPVLSPEGTPLMPTKPSRARRWIKEEKAVGKFNDLGQFYVQLKVEPSDTKTQPISIGIDPGKMFSGIGVQSAKFTLWTGHLELPFKRVRERMDNRRLMRRSRRGRRINRKLSFELRAHRQSLRKGARSGKGFSAVMVGQKWMLKQLEQFGKVQTIYGWQTSNLRKYLRLEKSKDKSEQSVNSHAVDGITLACYHFLDYQAHFSHNSHGHSWQGNVIVTLCPFAIVKRPPISRRQLHLMVPSKGGSRRKYGGTTTEFGLRKGDLVNSPKGIGYVSGQTKKQISVSDANWKRLGQIAFSKVTLIRRSNGLVVSC